MVRHLLASIIWEGLPRDTSEKRTHLQGSLKQKTVFRSCKQGETSPWNDLPSKTTDPLDPKRSLINQMEKPIPYQAAKEAELEEDAEGAGDFET